MSDLRIKVFEKEKIFSRLNLLDGKTINGNKIDLDGIYKDWLKFVNGDDVVKTINLLLDLIEENAE